MDYERIHKPTHQLGGFSPSKLRAMLLGVEKLRKEEEEVASRLSARSDGDDVVTSHGFKDVENATSNGQRDWDQKGGRIRIQDEDTFEFHKLERRPGMVLPFSKPTPSKWDDAEKWIASPTANRTGKGIGGQLKKSGLMGYGNRNPVGKVTDELPSKPVVKREHKAVNWVPEPYPVFDLGANARVLVDGSVLDSEVSLSQHDSSEAIYTAAALTSPPSGVQSVSMRDMGTEMTPIASQEPSLTGTPENATPPARSTTSSRHSTPERRARSSDPVKVDESSEGSSKELSEKELQVEVRRDIVVLGTKLGKTNITAWASQEQEGTEISNDKIGIDSPAASWAEAQKAKYNSRFREEEIKIQAWENHRKAKTEAKLKKTEVKAEKRRAHAQNRLMLKLAAATHKAEEKRTAAETKRNQRAARTEQQAEYIRKTGRVPSLPCCGFFP